MRGASMDAGVVGEGVDVNTIIQCFLLNSAR